ncbi:MAG: dTMP kinase [Candidatus Hodarchaeota archaeon]
MAKLSQGVLIAFEGIDGSGKTTQIVKVAQFLENNSYKVTITHEPNHNSPYYEFIEEWVKKRRNEITPEQELEWYVKDRKWDLENNITPALKKKHVVLVDRYYLSNAAYQGALSELTLDYVLKENSFARKPDLWIILDVPVNLGQARLQQRNDKGEDQREIADYQEEVRKNYEKLTEMDIGGKIEWVNASGEEDELTLSLGNLILEFLKEFD